MDSRVIELKDCANAVQLLIEYNKRINCSLSQKDLLTWINRILSVGDPLCILDEGRIIAFLLLYCNKFDTLEAYICNVFVEDKYRGQKLSKLLVEKAVSICSDRKFKMVALDVAEDNIAARKVYEQCGFFNWESYDKDGVSYYKMDVRL